MPLATVETFSIQPQFSGMSVVIDRAAPDTPFGTAATNEILLLHPDAALLLFFPLRKVPPNLVVTNAKIAFFMRDTGSVTVTASRVTLPWDRSATWNARSSDQALLWNTPGGDSDPAFLWTETFGGGIGWHTLGDGNAFFLRLVNDWLDEFLTPSGLLVTVTSGSASAYAMEDRGKAHDEQHDTSEVLLNRTTKYHPNLQLTGRRTLPAGDQALSTNVYTVQDQVTRYTLNRPTTHLPVRLGDGIPYLDRMTPCSDLVEEWSFRRARKQMAATIEMRVDRDDSDNFEAFDRSHNFWYPMEVVTFAERFGSAQAILRPTPVAIGVIDTDAESGEHDLSSNQITLRDPAMYGLISSFEGTLQNTKLPVPTDTVAHPDGVILTGEITLEGYIRYRYYDPVTGEPVKNWCSDPDVELFRGTGTHKTYFKQSEQVKVFHGLGEVWVEVNFFFTPLDQGGMGSPDPNNLESVLRIKFERYSTVFDGYFDAMPLNYALYVILRDCGFHHIEPPGYLYIQALPPVYADFVFDKVYHGTDSGGPATDVSNLVQNESGAPLVDAVEIGQGEALFFRMDRQNGRFSRIYVVMHTPPDLTASFSWWIYLGGGGGVWEEVTPEDPAYEWTWLTGATDPGVDNFQGEGVVVFRESTLAGWTTNVLAGTDGVSGFWMKAVCTQSGNPAKVHRFAGKSVMLLGQDRAANTWSHFDEQHHFELVQELIDRWGVPNYYVAVDALGDVTGRALVQKATPDYQLTPLEKVQRLRDATKVFTEVRVQVSQNLSTDVKNYSSVFETAITVAPHFTWTDTLGHAYNSEDFAWSEVMWVNPQFHLNPTLQEMRDRAIDGHNETWWGYDYVASSQGRATPAPPGAGVIPSPQGTVDVNQLNGAVLLEVQFAANGGPVAVEVVAISVYVSCPIVTLEGFYPEDPHNLGDGTHGKWGPIPYCSQRRDWGRAPGVPNIVNFTTTPSIARPILSRVRLIINEPNFTGPKTQASQWSAVAREIVIRGVALGTFTEGIAILGTTPPFDTAADQATYNRFQKRVFTVANNPYLSTLKDANRAALNILRELYRLVDPLQVSGVYPFVAVGDTVRVQNSVLALDSTYLVEAIEGRPYGTYTADLVPYRFSTFTTPTPVVPPLRSAFQVPPERLCLPALADGGTLPVTPLWRFAADEPQIVRFTNQTISVWPESMGTGAKVIANVLGQGAFLTGSLNGKPVADFSPGHFMGADAGNTPPVAVHMFWVLFLRNMTGDAALWTGWTGAQMITQNLTELALSADGTHWLVLPGVPATTWIIVDAYLAGGASFFSLNNGVKSTGDAGVLPAGAASFLYGDAISNDFVLADHLGFAGLLNDSERTQTYQSLGAKWGLA